MKRITVSSSRFEGYCEQSELPFKPGDIVIIPKGTKIRHMHFGDIEAKKTYKIRVHHLMPGSSATPNMMDAEEREKYGLTPDKVTGEDFYRGYFPLTNPKVVWPGAGNYWSEVDINDILTANGK